MFFVLRQLRSSHFILNHGGFLGQPFLNIQPFKYKDHLVLGFVAFLLRRFVMFLMRFCFTNQPPHVCIIVVLSLYMSPGVRGLGFERGRGPFLIFIAKFFEKFPGRFLF